MVNSGDTVTARLRSPAAAAAKKQARADDRVTLGEQPRITVSSSATDDLRRQDQVHRDLRPVREIGTDTGVNTVLTVGVTTFAKAASPDTGSGTPGTSLTFQGPLETDPARQRITT